MRGIFATALISSTSLPISSKSPQQFIPKALTPISCAILSRSMNFSPYRATPAALQVKDLGVKRSELRLTLYLRNATRALVVFVSRREVYPPAQGTSLSLYFRAPLPPCRRKAPRARPSALCRLPPLPFPMRPFATARPGAGCTRAPFLRVHTSQGQTG